MARTSSSIRVSFPFHAAVDGELRRHAARTGIPTAEIIRRAFDLYEALLYQYQGTIPPEMVQPAVQPDGQPYPNTIKRIPFYIDPYLAHKLKPWEGQEAQLLGYAVLCYIGMWALINPEDAEHDVTYVDQGVVEPPAGEAGETQGEEALAEEGGEGEGEPEGLDEGGTDDELDGPEPADQVQPGAEAGAEETGPITGEDGEIFTEAEPNTTEHLDAEGQPTVDIHGNPIGTYYDKDGNVTNLDRDGNLINWDEYGYPEGTTYDENGQPNNLDEDGFPIIAQAEAA